MSKSTPKPPAAPDYAAAATAQGAANVSGAQAGASLSNPNIISPYGNQTVTYGNTGPNGDSQPTVTQTLTPAAQSALDAQQQVQLGEANLANQGLTAASGILGTPFNPNLPDLQTSVGQGGPLATGAQAGALQGAPTPGQLNYGPNAGDYGANNTLNLSGVAPLAVNAGMTGQNALLSRLEPQLQQNEAATAQRLANQGITPGSEAYNNAMRTQGQNRNDLELQAASQGIGLDQSANAQGYGQALSTGQFANQAQGQNYTQAANSAGLYDGAQGTAFDQGVTGANLANQNQNTGFNQGIQNAQLNNQTVGQGFNQALQGAQFGNQANAQSLSQQLALYNQPLNAINALQSGSQIQNPQFQAYSGQNVAPAPVFQGVQAQDQAAQNLYGIQASQAASNQAGLFGALGTAASAAPLLFSDARLKSNIIKIADDPRGFGIYEYDIVGRREQGVMAQEIECIMPHAVFNSQTGVKLVNYEALKWAA